MLLLHFKYQGKINYETTLPMASGQEKPATATPETLFKIMGYFPIAIIAIPLQSSAFAHARCGADSPVNGAVNL